MPGARIDLHGLHVSGCSLLHRRISMWMPGVYGLLIKELTGFAGTT